MSGAVMVDLSSDFWQAVTVTWACFGMGVAVFHLVPRSWFSVWLSRGLLALCPLVWTCWGVHAVRVNQQLAIMVEAKQSQGVNDGGVVQLASTDVVESGSGRRYERIECRDGNRTTSTGLRDFHGRAGSIDVGVRPTVRQDRIQSGSIVGMPASKITSGVRWY